MNFGDVFFSVPAARAILSLTEPEMRCGDFVAVEGRGLTGARYGSKLPELRNVGPGLATQRGFIAQGRVVIESTVLSIYPQFVPSGSPDISISETSNHVQHIQIFWSGYHNLRKAQAVDRAVLALSGWDTNYQHFIIESYTRIWLAAEFAIRSGLPIIVLDRPYIRDIIETALPGLDVIYVADGVAVEVREACFVVMPIGQNMDRLVRSQIEALCLLRNKVMDATDALGITASPLTRTFLYRRNLPSNTGATRLIANHDEVTAVLNARGFEPLFLEERSLVEKCAALRGSRLIVSPIGANLMNLLFLRSGARALVINHPKSGAFLFFREMLDAVGVGLISCNLLAKVSFADPANDSGNAGYIVDAEELETAVDALLLSTAGDSGAST